MSKQYDLEFEAEDDAHAAELVHAIFKMAGVEVEEEDVKESFSISDLQYMDKVAIAILPTLVARHQTSQTSAAEMKGLTWAAYAYAEAMKRARDQLR